MSSSETSGLSEAHIVYCFKQCVVRPKRLIPGDKFCQHRWLSNLETTGQTWKNRISWENKNPQMMKAVTSARLTYSALERLQNIPPTWSHSACGDYHPGGTHSGQRPKSWWGGQVGWTWEDNLEKEEYLCRIYFVVLVIIFPEENHGRTESL